ncbi:MAG: IS66 family transposase [Bacteroidota bacterium]|nr:IS66 family transposase [Bacteroidota bacterium]
MEIKKADLDKLFRTIDNLKKEVQSLKDRLAKYESPKNSSNSSVPPSQDENRPIRTKSLRAKSNKSVGGQKGHKGHTLEMTKNPDKIIDIIPKHCEECNKSLSSISAEYVGSRQTIDIPPVRPIYTEYKTYKKTCSCGCQTISKYPKNVISYIGYGENIESLTAYLHTRQYVPYQRMQELFNTIFNVPISQAGLHNILDKFAKKAEPVYNIIKNEIIKSKVVGTDETGARINNKRGWMWAWQTKNLTYIKASDNRSARTILDTFENGLPNSILINDHWKPHYKSGAKTHQMCIAHLLRELNYLTELYKQSWSSEFKILLLDAIELKKHMIATDYFQPNAKRNEIISRFEKLLLLEVDSKYKKMKTFHKRMVDYKTYIFTFLYYYSVPPDNNGSERSVRNIKVKQKISGQFKNIVNAQNFAIIRSVIDTAIKNGQNIINALNLISLNNFNFAE